VRSRALLVGGAIGGCAVACSLAGFDDFSGGATDPADAAAVDVSDRATSSSSGGEGGADGAVTFCSTVTGPVVACLDFEDGRLPLGFAIEQDGASGKIDDQGKDGSKGFTSTVGTGTADDASACVAAKLGTQRTSIVLEADVRFSAAGSGNYDIFTLNTGADRQLGVSVTGTALKIEEEHPDGGNDVFIATTGSVKETFQRIRFAVQIDGTTAHSEVFVDGVSVGKHDAFGGTASGDTTLEIGDCILAATDGWTVHFDNVVVTETK
jgi:hypothetical protein